MVEKHPPIASGEVLYRRVNKNRQTLTATGVSSLKSLASDGAVSVTCYRASLRYALAAASRCQLWNTKAPWMRQRCGWSILVEGRTRSKDGDVWKPPNLWKQSSVIICACTQQAIPPVNSETYFLKFFAEQFQVRFPFSPPMVVNGDVEPTGDYCAKLIIKAQVALLGPQPNNHLTRQTRHTAAGHTSAVGQQGGGNGKPADKFRDDWILSDG